MRGYYDEDLETWVVAEPSPSAEDEFFASQEDGPHWPWQETMLALESLTPKQRFAVECYHGLRSAEGDTTPYSIEEIADLMGITKQATWLIYNRGIATLRRLLGA